MIGVPSEVEIESSLIFAFFILECPVIEKVWFLMLFCATILFRFLCLRRGLAFLVSIKLIESVVESCRKIVSVVLHILLLSLWSFWLLWLLPRDLMRLLIVLWLFIFLWSAEVVSLMHAPLIC